mmetsp:Transcript_8872/g.24573  ORF Transcript_8872/g.24573 Transcript_8872/m.24573 type:complete len:106 (+) Transcript_8872:671-988(+)
MLPLVVSNVTKPILQEERCLLLQHLNLLLRAATLCPVCMGIWDLFNALKRKKEIRISDLRTINNEEGISSSSIINLLSIPNREAIGNLCMDFELRLMSDCSMHRG